MATPESAGTFRRKSMNGSSPPAEAPTPMIGKCGLSCAARAGAASVSSLSVRLVRPEWGSCGVNVYDCTCHEEAR